jgi:hypothetical protein
MSSSSVHVVQAADVQKSSDGQTDGKHIHSVPPQTLLIIHKV